MLLEIIWETAPKSDFFSTKKTQNKTLKTEGIVN